jgi:transcriptional regulator with XRE-family HTH domain
MLPGEQVKQLRKASGLLQREFAAAVGVNPRTVGLWERGRNAPTAARLSFIRFLFGKKPHDVVPAETIGGRIRALRLARGLSRAEFAAEVGVGAQSVAHWENDRQGLSKMRAALIAERFGMPSDWLRGRGSGETCSAAEPPGTVGGRLRALRDAAGMSEEAFGAVARVGLYAVLRWERDCYPPKPRQVDAIAAHFGVTAAWILDGADAPDLAALAREARRRKPGQSAGKSAGKRCGQTELNMI